MAKTKLSEAVEEKVGKKEPAQNIVKKEKEISAPKEAKESTAQVAQAETQGMAGKSPDQMIEENLVVLMNLDHEKLDNKALKTAIAHLAVTVLILKKALDAMAQKAEGLNQDMGTLTQAHATQAQDIQNAKNSMLELHNRMNTMQPKQPTQIPQQQTAQIPQ